MRSLLYTAAASVLLSPLVLLAAEKAEPSGSCGTNIDFYDTPKEAAWQAAKEQKLVFVLHVSGNFEDPRFT
jgi:hypothetical protein